MLKIAEMVREHCHGISYDVELPGNISYCIEGGSSGNAKQFTMYTALKIAEVDG